MEIDTDKAGRELLRQVLKRAGYKDSHVSRMVNGGSTPSLDLALRIEDATGIPPRFWDCKNRGEAMWARIQEETRVEGGK